MIYIGKRQYKYGRMLMSHMISDKSIEELHQFAKLMGIRRIHFQNKDGKPHYDICKDKKKKALKLVGVIEADDRDLITLLKAYNENEKHKSETTICLV